MIVAGNKSDMFEYEEVDENSGRNFAKENNAVFKLVSAKSSFGIEVCYI
ncbi:MAG: hypothetical protein ACKO96_18715, partial [Flammeovirgaceae bacterium]